MAGTIKIGAPNDLRTYNVSARSRSTIQWVRSQANPFASKLNTTSEFDTLDDWNEFVMEDWQAGRGKRDPTAGGFLYAQADTRFPRQFFLPHLADPNTFSDNPNGGRSYSAEKLDLDNDTNHAFAYSFFIPNVGQTLRTVWVYLEADEPGVLTVSIYDDNDGVPDTSVATRTGAIETFRPGGTWIMATGTPFDATADTPYHVVVESDVAIRLPGVDPRDIASETQRAHSYDGTDWHAIDSGFQYLFRTRVADTWLGLQDETGQILTQDEADSFLLAAFPSSVTAFAKVKNRVYAAMGTKVYRYDAGDRLWEEIHDVGTQLITDMIRIDDKLFVAFGTNYGVYDPDADDFAAASPDHPTDLFLVYGGFLWRTSANDLYYTSNFTTWTGPFTFGLDGHIIRGLAGLEEDLYIATDVGLYLFARGDVPLPVLKFPSESELNGVGMVEWNGALYIPLAEDIALFNSSGALQGVGLKRGEELPADIQGRVRRLLPTTYFLLATLDPETEHGTPTVWSFNDEGWHNIAQLPRGGGIGGMLLDTENRSLWVGAEGIVYHITYPSSVINPIREREPMFFARHGWLETDRFHGGHFLLDKDWESVFVVAETLGPDGRIGIYWQSETDAPDEEWHLLATVTEAGVEKRWDDYDLRPDGRWVKLGFLLYTQDVNVSPVVEAIVTKFMPMVNDLYRWSVSIPVHDDQERTAGLGMASQTAAQMTAHIESLIGQVKPFIFEDITGTQYEVKVEDHNLQAVEYEHYDESNQMKWEYHLTLKQITHEPYSVPE